jgi:copper chaperone CopZ
MSRAIADNLNCALNREHPLSKQWAAVIPPIPDNFSADKETLFKFLTTPLKPELLDTHDRKMRKLMEPKSVQQWHDIATGATSEERFYNALRLLEQWNYDYDKNPTPTSNCMSLTLREQKIREAHLAILTEKTKHCASKIEEILTELYADIKNTPIYKKVRNSLVEASKQLIKIKTQGATKDRVKNYTTLVDEIMQSLESIIDKHRLPKEATLSSDTVTKLFNLCFETQTKQSKIKTEQTVKSTYETRDDLYHKPYTVHQMAS